MNERSDRLGVLMLDTRFPRLRGDIGAPETFDFPVRYRVVRGASPQRVVRERAHALLEPFIAAGEALVRDDGATAIATSCGFLVLFQQALQAVLPVPVWTSSLLLLPELQAARGVHCVGVLTADAESLSVDHLRAAGAAAETPIEGLARGCAFQRCLLENHAHFDPDDARGATVAAARRLVARSPGLTDIVLECTNLPPYAEAVRAATGRAVHDITTLLNDRFPRSAHHATSST
jgi:hypothetical protein